MADISTILGYVKEWYKSSPKSNEDLKNLIEKKITIHGYTFDMPSFAHRAHIMAIKDGEPIKPAIIDLGSPDTPDEVLSKLREKLTNNAGGRRRRRSTKKYHKKSKKHTRRR